mmetsp:Transcript_25229/g.22365  ORF Transcript_25229/g.22365 Transcript_25229/m.22365 type:complete len:83 (+) Transcript_25229:251-499(+)|eukprot:CAMPEP_0205800724 /NCGR_PEP_ID=MMETSP0205-20121125/2479_1 /ASSEMBLY_ACC=CAM_ASM_000278 /TAXON_ID=36767 /ORGANISM="Euplotes focardii, Strain TN1" /LENGTH=82 /DNA_ID=CAMNT_0053064291 /DNA_START=240 /DNA_END=488 /DNA_ORIENTATION=-
MDYKRISSESTADGENPNEDSKAKEDSINPKMLISLEMQEASLVKKLVILYERKMNMAKSKFCQKRRKLSEDDDYTSSDDEE